MHKIVLLCIGSLKESWAREACAMYEERLKKQLEFAVLELPPSKIAEGDKQREEESGRIVEKMKSFDGEVWVLDERGKEISSEQLSLDVESLRDQGRSLLLVLGGAYGMNDAVRTQSSRILALSSMTFPHELCRVIVLEQLFRACEISRGSGYHHT